jgi:hypothetical protein
MISGSSFSGLSRGNILKTSACLTLGSLAGYSSLSTVLEGKGGIALVLAPANVVPLPKTSFAS